MSMPVLSELIGVSIKKTRYQKLHIVTKLLVPFSISIALIYTKSEIPALFLLIVSLLMNVIAGIPLKTVKKYIIVLISVTVFIALSFSLFTYVPGNITFFETTILRIKAERGYVEWKLLISDKSLEYIALFSLRIITMMLVAVLLLGSVSDREIIWGLRSVKAPYALCMFVALFFRGISFFINDFLTIRDAMQVRGVEIERASLREKFTAYIYALIPLITLMVRRSYDMSLALEARGLKLSSKFSGKYYVMKITKSDILIIASFIVLPLLLYLYDSLG